MVIGWKSEYELTYKKTPSIHFPISSSLCPLYQWSCIHPPYRLGCASSFKDKACL